MLAINAINMSINQVINSFLCSGVRIGPIIQVFFNTVYEFLVPLPTSISWVKCLLAWCHSTGSNRSQIQISPLYLLLLFTFFPAIY